jgi:hypothetical protein
MLFLHALREHEKTLRVIVVRLGADPTPCRRARHQVRDQPGDDKSIIG